MDNLDTIFADPEEFEKTWVACIESVVEAIMADTEIQEIKEEVRTAGHVTDEHRERFIVKVNEIKNRFVEARYGALGSDDYQKFVHAWENWMKLKGKDRPKAENMYEENINHLLYGSTPDADMFLRDFNIYTDVK